MTELEPLDPGYVQSVLSKPPFVTVDGVHNIRDLGLACPNSVRPGLLYRSAELSAITPDAGAKQLAALGIKQVFDLRSDTEIAKWKSPIPTIEGVTIERAPVFTKDDYSPEMMARRYQLYASGKTEAFMELYSQILDHGGPAFGTIFRHVRDRPQDPCLFHCTAGKDRTGVLAALFLKLAGATDEAIAEDYALTRIGREPARELVLRRLSAEPLFAANSEAALNMFTCRKETMLAFLDLLQERYGGVEDYLENFAGFSTYDIEQVMHALIEGAK